MRVRSALAAFRAATAAIGAVAVLAALDVATAADFAPWELPGTTDADRAASAALQLRNRARLRSLAARTNASLPRLCGGPFGPPAAAPLRLLHIPKTGSTFTTTFLRHACPAMPLDAAMGTRIPRDRRWVLDGRRNVADYDAMSLPGQHKRAKFPTSKAHISAVLHSFWLIFGRVIIPRNGLEAWMLFSGTRARGTLTLKLR